MQTRDAIAVPYTLSVLGNLSFSSRRIVYGIVIQSKSHPLILDMSLFASQKIIPTQPLIFVLQIWPIRQTTGDIIIENSFAFD
mmetsp:Transcript_37035/g.66665  ORF Transcript_37035/g.66665 Transcript_37035/m.66665 type:complete len:83 (+) Transcript_37035:332-580(+)